MTTLVTGGKGFLGAELIRQLAVEEGQDVVCLDVKSTPGRLVPLTDRVRLVGGGVTGPDEMESLIRENEIDLIAHMVFARPGDDPGSIHDEIATMVMGTTSVFEAARRTGVRRVAFPSSIHYYGPQWLHGDVALSEDAPGLATTIYGVTKQLNEATASAYVARAEMRIVCVRLPAVYGPNAEVGARSINVAPVAAARGTTAVVPYAPDQRVCVAHVQDVARCLARALTADRLDHLVYNVGGHTTTYEGIATLVRRYLPDADIRFNADQGPSDLPYLIDDSRARQELGLRHRPLEQGVLEVINATRQQAGLEPLDTGAGSVRASDPEGRAT